MSRAGQRPRTAMQQAILRERADACQRGPIEQQSRAADPAPLDAVEWELIRADIALKKAEWKTGGDWSKWKASQKEFRDLEKLNEARGWAPVWRK